MFISKCPLRRENIPILPCDCKDCDWYIFSTGNNNCFWVLCEKMTFGEEKSFEEIAQMLGITKEEAINIYENALGKIRRDPERMKALEELLKEAAKQADESES